jgi:ABC-type transport system involved in cytochrome c biogenesis permease subunit
MATVTLPTTRVPVASSHAGAGIAGAVLRSLGSLKITVIMFLAAEFLLLVGTLAQDEKNLPDVKAEYFNSWVARVPLADFFPVTIFGPSTLSGWFPFPGGATIGLVLLVNLIAAKATRFHVAARGSRLVWGTVLAILGAAITLAVVLTGHRSDGLQGRPPLAYDTVWALVQGGGVLLAVGLAAAAARSRHRLVRVALGLAAAAVGVPTALTLAGGPAWRMSDPGLRIMWQLVQSSGASLVLLAGLVAVFGRRGGNVLIHIAVGLLMLGQFVFGDRQIEERLNLVEGQTTSVAFRTDETELALVDSGDTTDDRVTAVSGRLLAARAGGAAIEVDGLPFDLVVVDYFPNSTVTRAAPQAVNPATAGIGLTWLATARPPQGGASAEPNIASAYVRLQERGSGRDLGTHLVTQFLNDQAQLFVGAGADECDTVEAGGRRWRLQLRYRREYKPYAVRLDDVRRINYSASETPRDYSSYVTFTDRASGAEQKGRIWMNNPVRYRGETFYQSQYSQVDLGEGQVGEMTGLQVVENAGWLIPYVACVLAFWGMLFHFGGTFLRFADRHERDGRATDDTPAAPDGRRRRSRVAAGGQGSGDRGGWLATALALGLVAACAVPASLPRKPRAGVADWPSAGTIPVMHEGRIKPLDTVARNILQLLGSRASVRLPDAADDAGPTGTVPATRWLLATMAGSEWAARSPVFRIDAQEVVDLFDLSRRKGHRYAASELEAGRPALRREMERIRGIPADQRSFAQKKYAEIEQKLMAYDLIRFAYDVPELPRPETTAGGDEARSALVERVRRLLQNARLLEENHPAAVIPPVDAESAGASQGPDGRWRALYPAVAQAILGRLVDGRAGAPAFRANPAILPFTAVLEAVDRPAAEFDAALVDYRRAIDGLPQAAAAAPGAAFEAWLNAFDPTGLAKWLYVLATVLCFASFLVWHRPLNRFVTALIVGTVLLHTFALAARIWLTGRPPVVNLYSSAVFIGWACVLAGLALESLHRLGIGNLVAAVSGGLTLMVAYGLDSGDTMHVLQAVLDTQFWLSTHVVTVTLGYGATFLAGLLGTCAIVHRAWVQLFRGGAARPADRRIGDELDRMTYGVVCFALFFSFIGTVLGGLWADDSWGRFWGWDPKENGALMIVLWNAAALHARWDKWIGPRGFALFAIGGNIVTAWSWFGTNQLGIGLHSYGFTTGVLMLLAAYVLSQLLLIVAGAWLTRSGWAAAPRGSAPG